MYFNKVSTVEELKRQYRHLVLENHPDAGGTEEIMKQINAEYEKLFARVGNIHESINEPGETYEKEGAAVEDGYRDIIDALAGLAAKGLITIEICGTWLWIGGNTWQYKDLIKGTGCKWSGSKKMWYWHSGDTPHKKSRGWDINKIRAVWGSEALEFAGSREIAATI